MEVAVVGVHSSLQRGVFEFVIIIIITMKMIGRVMINMIEMIEMIKMIIEMIRAVVLIKIEVVNQRSMTNKNRCQLLHSKNIICRMIFLMIEVMMTKMIITTVIIAKEKKI